MPARVSVIGQQYGRLTVIGEAVRTDPRRRRVLCRCACGNDAVSIDLDPMRAGRVQSCGCLQVERCVATNTTHGMTGTPEHRTWKSIKTRCTNPKAQNYERYGGRGVTMCREWADPETGFAAFFAHIGPRPGPEFTIDRIKNELGYQPWNVRWATRREQARNTTRNIWVEMNGRRQILADWCRELGRSEKLMQWRIKSGMDPILALLTPTRKKAA